MSSFVATRWLLSFAMTVIICLQPNVETVGVLFGLLIAIIVGKTLKRVLAFERPKYVHREAHVVDSDAETAARQHEEIRAQLGHGMPSSHANAVTFLATSFISAVIDSYVASSNNSISSNHFQQPFLKQLFLRAFSSFAATAVAVSATMLLCLYLCLRRVHLQLHDYAQVGVGAILGLCSALLTHNYLLPQLHRYFGSAMLVGDGSCSIIDLAKGACLMGAIMPVMGIVVDRRTRAKVSHYVFSHQKKRIS